MGFFKEGKKLSYSEVIETVDALIKKDILPQLEVKELSSLSTKILNFTEETLSQALKAEGYKPKKQVDIFSVALQLNLLNQAEVWKKAEEIKENDEEMDKEEMIQFFTHDYLAAMKNLEKKLKAGKKVSSEFM